MTSGQRRARTRVARAARPRPRRSRPEPEAQGVTFTLDATRSPAQCRASCFCGSPADSRHDGRHAARHSGRHGKPHRRDCNAPAGHSCCGWWPSKDRRRRLRCCGISPTRSRDCRCGRSRGIAGRDRAQCPPLEEARRRPSPSWPALGLRDEPQSLVLGKGRASVELLYKS